MTDLRIQLQETVGGTYRLEKELGGGGMSRVFLAEEVELGRMVVIKVLPPEMAAGVNQDRFRREIQLAARLQHSHIVPLLTAGSAGDLLYYVMPFIEGESLRAKLAREGELPVAEAVRILREVTDALAYAHDRGIVHRDIKPDNVMLSSGHALVTDFGVAKAVSESTGEASLTSLGMALGTPAYMAPEQASGDPHVDHRADLYAVGILAFEMLAGRPPFTAASPQALLAAQVTQTPDRVSALRPAVSPALEAVVMRCLEKRAADRWQSAREMAPHLESGTPTSGGTQPTSAVPTISSGTAAALQQTHPLRVALLFALAAVGVLAIVYLAVQQLGLPDWVFSGAIALLALGAPIVLYTGHHERQRALARATSAQTATPTGLKRHFTWRKAVLGGVAAFAVLGLAAAVYTVMRLAGIGPVGTLVAKGTLSVRERIVLAEWENHTADSALGSTVTELLRIDLAQSPMLTVYDAAQTGTVLSRMQLSPETPVTFAVAKEVATREGLKAVLAGEIRPLASGYVLSARLVSPATDEILWAGRQDVASADQLSAAIEKLSATLRERVGESLRSIRADAPLDQVTTRSLEGLRSYVQAQRAQNLGNEDEAIALVERSIAQDSGFAMAYRKLGVLLWNQGRDRPRMLDAFTKANALRDRLSPRERYHAEAMFKMNVEGDSAGAVAAYQALLEKYPDDRTALNNLGVFFDRQGRGQDALAIYKRTIALGGAPSSTYGNVIPLEYRLGSRDTARKLLQQYAEAYAENPQTRLIVARFYAATEQYDSAYAVFDSTRIQTRGNSRWEPQALGGLSNLTRLQGRLVEARRWELENARLAYQRNPSTFRDVPRQEFLEAVALSNEAEDVQRFTGDAGRARMLMDRALQTLPVERFPPEDRDRLGSVTFYARVGAPERAREFLQLWERETPDSVRQSEPVNWIAANGDIAMAEGRYDDALREYRKIRDRLPACEGCWMFEIAQAHDRKGATDSAIATFERLLAGQGLGVGDVRKGVIWRSLGQLSEKKGDKAKALEYYGKFVDLWKTADAELQPRVEEARRWIAQLAGEGRP